jgi:hypothetical protein
MLEGRDYEILVRFSDDKEDAEIVYIPIAPRGQGLPAADGRPECAESNGSPGLADWLRRTFDL